MPTESADELHAAATVFTFERGQTVLEPVPEPEFLFILKRGLIRTYRTNGKGRQVTLRYVQSGEVFGELAAFTNKPRESHAVAVEPSIVIKLGRQAFIDAIQSRPSIVFSVAAQIADRLEQLESRVEDFAFRGAHSRVARTVLRLAEQFGRQVGEQLVVDIRLSQTDIATLAGISRPTANILLGGLEDEGLITRRGKQIVVKDQERLRGEADWAD